MIHDFIKKVNYSRDQALEIVTRDAIGMIVTLNPEMVFAARKDPWLQDIIQRASLVLPDGIGIVWAAGILTKKRIMRIAGIDFAEHIFFNPPEGLRRVFLLGGRHGVAETAAHNLMKRFPALEFAGFSDIAVDRDGNAMSSKEERKAMQQINNFNPELLLVGFGVPKQEKWISRMIDSRNQSLRNVRVVMGIGGALDVWAGRLPRAPRWMRNLGLEWLWRFVIQPQRASRIFRAAVVFPLFVFYERFFPKAKS